jgi:hypothetical protein
LWLNVTVLGDRAFTGKTPYAKYEGGFGCNLTKDLMFQLILFSRNYTYNYMWSNMNADGNAPTKPSSGFDYWTQLIQLPQDQLKTTFWNQL